MIVDGKYDFTIIISHNVILPYYTFLIMIVNGKYADESMIYCIIKYIIIIIIIL